MITPLQFEFTTFSVFLLTARGGTGRVVGCVAFPVSDAVPVFWYLLSACCSTHFLIPCICIDVVVSVHFADPDRRVTQACMAGAENM